MLIPFGTMSSGSQAADVANQISFNTRTYTEDLSGGSSGTQQSHSTSLSAGSVGDLSILWERRINGASTEEPAANLNSGWTSIGTFPTNAGNEFRNEFSYKIMTASDIASGTVTTGQAEVQTNTLLFFTPTQVISSVTVYGFTSQATAGTLSNQTQSISSSGASAPVIMIATKTTHGGESHSANMGTASFDATFAEAISASKISPDDFRIGYIIQNSTLSDVTVSYTDEGNNQQAASFHIEVT
tara:strand:+ start:638 stop:1366 length:729 start_codon:yes stop_codon:yes gene_type:complete